MRISIAIAVLAALFITDSASAETLKAGYPVCITQDLLEQDHIAVAKSDIDALGWLAEHGCGLSSEGVRATVLGAGGFGSYVHIRAYRGKHAVEAWVDKDAVEGYDPLSPSVFR